MAAVMAEQAAAMQAMGGACAPCPARLLGQRPDASSCPPRGHGGSSAGGAAGNAERWGALGACPCSAVLAAGGRCPLQGWGEGTAQAWERVNPGDGAPPAQAACERHARTPTASTTLQSPQPQRRPQHPPTPGLSARRTPEACFPHSIRNDMQLPHTLTPTGSPPQRWPSAGAQPQPLTPLQLQGLQFEQQFYQQQQQQQARPPRASSPGSSSSQQQAGGGPQRSGPSKSGGSRSGGGMLGLFGLGGRRCAAGGAAPPHATAQGGHRAFARPRPASRTPAPLWPATAIPSHALNPPCPPRTHAHMLSLTPPSPSRTTHTHAAAASRGRQAGAASRRGPAAARAARAAGRGVRGPGGGGRRMCSTRRRARGVLARRAAARAARQRRQA